MVNNVIPKRRPIKGMGGAYPQFIASQHVPGMNGPPSLRGRRAVAATRIAALYCVPRLKAGVARTA